MAEDIVRVTRVLQYVGPRSRVEEVIANSVQGTKHWGKGMVLHAATLGAWPEVLFPANSGRAQLEDWLAQVTAAADIATPEGRGYIDALRDLRAFLEKI